MIKITTKYEFNLENGILLKRTKLDEIVFNYNLEQYEIKLILKHEGGYAQINKIYSFIISKVQLDITTTFEKDIPEIIENEKSRNLAHRAKYFHEIERSLYPIAYKIINQFIHFFKYYLKQPKLEFFKESYHSFHDPKYYNEAGSIIETGSIRLMGTMYKPDDYLKTGSKEFTSEFDNDFINYMKDPPKLELYKEILSDAQTAFFDKNYRRAILEMAISCEIATKHKLFFENEKTGLIFNYLEDKNKINVRVLELIDGASKYVFNKSFKETNKNDYNNIDFLFRTRNKIVHRGEMSFIDDNGKIHHPDQKEIYKWWDSINKLFDWINQL